jgi:hypothetical protein
VAHFPERYSLFIVLAAADGYSYLQLLLWLGSSSFAVGAKSTVAHAGDPLSDAARLPLCGGVALYLARLAAFGLRMTGVLGRGRVAAAVACLVVFAVGVPAWATAALLTALLGALAFSEMPGARRAVPLPGSVRPPGRKCGRQSRPLFFPRPWAG